ncbi:TPA: hypothetical protein QA360_002635 [Enterococcus faecalis]|uniref:VE23 n=1 Tax=Enterococcus faecalis TaxID=1351 RepID=C4P4K0_ENTFL|nr:hypothetical protein [Enterococcus faecalis]ACQ89883.1 VE23 [Enterococcus faecalis]MDE3927515.1 hypothetical protein [Enterococcus faecalis]MDE3939190.1 hypothetical protein [Enterococcus faecalis]HDQ5280479.1 hypothetical protein [Enterococcus faecalis]HDQ5281431.1 hypothetical protein [Enterococcus faecalis]
MRKIKIVGSILLLGVGVVLITSSIVNANSNSSPIKATTLYGYDNINRSETLDSNDSLVEVSPFNEEIASRTIELTTVNR